MRKTGNRGYIKFEDKIIKSFISLFMNKAGSKICVEDVLKKADVCRTTFYKHFQSIEDIYLGVENFIAQEFSKIMFKDFKWTVNNLDLWFDQLFKRIEKNIEFYTSLAYSSHLSGIIQSISQKICEKMREFGKAKCLSNEYIEASCIVIYGTIGATFSAICAKLKNKVDISWKTLNNFCSDLIYTECNDFWNKIGILEGKKNYWKI